LRRSKNNQERAKVSSDDELRGRVSSLFKNQKLTVLSTQESNHPYLSLMAFAVTPDLKQVVVATQKGTRKHANILKKSGVALLVDNRLNQGKDFQDTVAVTGIGKAEEVQEQEKGELLRLYLEKHPELEGFATSSDCALIRVIMERYLIVQQFQDVFELKVS
jgi:general stress protein 26